MGTTSDGSRSSDELLGRSSCPMLMWIGMELSEGRKYCGVCVCVCVCGGGGGGGGVHAFSLL